MNRSKLEIVSIVTDYCIQHDGRAAPVDHILVRSGQTPRTLIRNCQQLVMSGDLIEPYPFEYAPAPTGE